VAAARKEREEEEARKLAETTKPPILIKKEEKEITQSVNKRQELAPLPRQEDSQEKLQRLVFNEDDKIKPEPNTPSVDFNLLNTPRGEGQ
jgi:hypothetical protein